MLEVAALVRYNIMYIELEQKVSGKKQFGFRDETGIKSTERRWATVGFMRHTCTLNISYLNKF